MELLINVAGRSVSPSRRDVEVAVSKGGCVHISAIGRTSIVTFQPQLVSVLTIVGAAYELAALAPALTIVLGGIDDPQCRVCHGYQMALQVMEELASDARGGTAHASD